MVGTRLLQLKLVGRSQPEAKAATHVAEHTTANPAGKRSGMATKNSSRYWKVYASPGTLIKKNLGKDKVEGPGKGCPKPS